MKKLGIQTRFELAPSILHGGRATITLLYFFDRCSYSLSSAKPSSLSSERQPMYLLQQVVWINKSFIVLLSNSCETGFEPISSPCTTLFYPLNYTHPLVQLLDKKSCLWAHRDSNSEDRIMSRAL